MLSKRFFWWLAVVAAIAVPLMWSDSSLAESGCHRTGSGQVAGGSGVNQ